MTKKVKKLQRIKLEREVRLLEESIENEKRRRNWENRKIRISAGSIVLSAFVIACSLFFAIKPIRDNETAEERKNIEIDKREIQDEKEKLATEKEAVQAELNSLDLRTQVVLAEEAKLSLSLVEEKRDALSLSIKRLNEEKYRLVSYNTHLRSTIAEKDGLLKFSDLNSEINNLKEQKINPNTYDYLIETIQRNDDFSEHLRTKLLTDFAKAPSNLLKLEAYFIFTFTDQSYKNNFIEEFRNYAKFLSSQKVYNPFAANNLNAFLKLMDQWTKVDALSLTDAVMPTLKSEFFNIQNKIILVEFIMRINNITESELYLANTEAFIDILKLNNVFFEENHFWTIDELTFFSPQWFWAKFIDEFTAFCDGKIDQRGIIQEIQNWLQDAALNDEALIESIIPENEFLQFEDRIGKDGASELTESFCNILRRIKMNSEYYQWIDNSWLESNKGNPFVLINKIKDHRL